MNTVGYSLLAKLTYWLVSITVLAVHAKGTSEKICLKFLTCIRANTISKDRKQGFPVGLYVSFDALIILLCTKLL